MKRNFLLWGIQFTSILSIVREESVSKNIIYNIKEGEKDDISTKDTRL